MTTSALLDRRRLLALSAALLPGGRAQGQAAATPLRLLVPFAPGGATDSLARALASQLQDRLGPMQVDNRAGLRGSLGAEWVARAPADGNTLLLGSVMTHAINPWLGAHKLYDPIRDFTPIALLARMPNVLVMNAETARRLQIGSVAELVSHARRHPGGLSYGSSGMGSTGHLAAEMLKTRARIFMTHLPFAGVNPALHGLSRGEIDLGFQNLSSAAAAIRAGTLRALAVSTARRSSAMPDLPTVAESPARLGLAGFDVGIWFGLFGPARLAPDLTQRLGNAFIEALGSAELQERLALLKAEAAPGNAEQLASLLRLDLQRYELPARRSGATLD